MGYLQQGLLLWVTILSSRSSPSCRLLLFLNHLLIWVKELQKGEELQQERMVETMFWSSCITLELLWVWTKRFTAYPLNPSGHGPLDGSGCAGLCGITDSFYNGWSFRLHKETATQKYKHGLAPQENLSIQKQFPKCKFHLPSFTITRTWNLPMALQFLLQASACKIQNIFKFDLCIVEICLQNPSLHVFLLTKSLCVQSHLVLKHYHYHHQALTRNND